MREIQALLIEDNPGDSRLIREMLRSTWRERVVVHPVITLAEGIQVIRQQPFDLVLLDLSLPDSHGLDTLLRVTAEAPDLAVVVLTGLDDEETGIRALQAGAQDYLLKGDMDSKLLIRSIRYALERHRVELALRAREQEYRSLIDDVFDTSMVAVVILDRDYRVVWCNEATEVYFGLQREVILGRDKRKLIDSELKCIFADPDDYASRLLQAYDQGDFTDRFECHVLPIEGRYERWLEHWSQPIRQGMFAGGRIEQYTDITDRKLLEVAEREQREFAEALSGIATLLTSTLDLDDVLGRILTTLDRIVPHDSARITLMEDDHFQVAHRENGKCDTQDMLLEKQIRLDYRPYLDQMATTRRPIIVPALPPGSIADHQNVQAYIGAPIILQDVAIGFISLFSTEPDFFNSQHAERLSAFAELAAIAIQNARLYRQSQALAALEERQRLARELHDSVSQTLFTCRTMAESALRRWEKNPPQARGLMEEVHRLTISALSEMRILLLELRPTALTQVGMKQLFEQYLQPIQDRRQFRLTLHIDDFEPLPPEVQIALYRITQEALNNIDKHAQASHVRVSMEDQQGRVVMQIEDDGGGFDIEGVAATSLGLGIMHERAEKIGASLEIMSEIGDGTRIIIIWER